MSERFLMPGHKLPAMRWALQGACRMGDQDACGRVSMRTALQGALTPVEQDAEILFFRLLPKAREGDPLAALDIAKLIEAHAHEIVGFMGLFPGEVADEIFSMPARAAHAKRLALIEWQATGQMPALIRRWAERDPSVLEEYEAAGVTAAGAAPPPMVGRVGTGAPGGQAFKTILAAAVLAAAVWVVTR